MDDIDISREAVSRHLSCYGMATETWDLIDALCAAIDRADVDKAAAVEAMREAAIDAIKAIWSDVVEEMSEFGLEHPAQAEIDAIRALPARQRL